MRTEAQCSHGRYPRVRQIRDLDQFADIREHVGSEFDAILLRPAGEEMCARPDIFGDRVETDSRRKNVDEAKRRIGGRVEKSRDELPERWRTEERGEYAR